MSCDQKRRWILLGMGLFFILLTGCAHWGANPTNKKIVIAKINMQLGMSAIEKKDMKQAKAKLLLATQEAPQMPEVWYALAYYMEKMGNKTSAQYYYLKAIKLSPERSDVHNNYALFLCRSHRYHQAITQFDVAARNANPYEAASVYTNAGLCALRIPNDALAKRYFKWALKYDPAQPIAGKKLMELTRGTG